MKTHDEIRDHLGRLRPSPGWITSPLSEAIRSRNPIPLAADAAPVLGWPMPLCEAMNDEYLKSALHLKSFRRSVEAGLAWLEENP